MCCFAGVIHGWVVVLLISMKVFVSNYQGVAFKDFLKVASCFIMSHNPASSIFLKLRCHRVMHMVFTKNLVIASG